MFAPLPQFGASGRAVVCPVIEVRLLRTRITLLLAALTTSVAACGSPNDPAVDPVGGDTGAADAGGTADATDADGDLIRPMPDVNDVGNDVVPDLGPDDAVQDAAAGDGGTVDAGDTPEPFTGPSITVATWNTLRFFDTVCDSGTCGPDEYEPVLSPAQLRAAAMRVAQAVNDIDADIIVLQEVESAECVDALLAELDPNPYTVVVLGESGTDASLDVLTLARGELVEVVRHADTRLPRPGGGTTSFAREFLEVRLRVDGAEVTVFNAHFKSQSGDDPSRRLAEARAAHDIVTASAASRPGALTVFGGDLNDTPGSEPINALDDSGELLRVAGELGGDAATITFNGVSEAIDHLYFANAGAGAYLRGSAAVLRNASGGFGGSDHAALRADFALPGFEP